MADNTQDPAGSTQMFRAFVDEGANGPSRQGSSGRTGLIVGGVLVTLVVLVAVVWLAVK